MARLMTVLCACLFLMGIGLDYISTDESFSQIFPIRLIVVSSLLITFAITFKKDFFLIHYFYLVAAIYLITAFSIITMIHYTSINEIAHTTYFAGLMLIIVTVFLGTYIDTITSIAISCFMISAFIFMAYLNKDKINTMLLINNLFFLGSSVVVGVISNTMRNKFLVEKIFFQDRLKESLREERAMLDEQTQLANMDGLTNIANRRYSKEKLELMRKDAEKLDMALVILFMDLNKFKFINDTYGHRVGDQVLMIVANRLDGLMRKNDLVSRQGGDEFLIAFLVNKDNMDYIKKLEQNVTNKITKTMEIDGLRLSVGVSLGCAIYPHSGESITSLLEIADHKMYQSKKDQFEANDFLYDEGIENVTNINIRSKNK